MLIDDPSPASILPDTPDNDLAPSGRDVYRSGAENVAHDLTDDWGPLPSPMAAYDAARAAGLSTELYADGTWQPRPTREERELERFGGGDERDDYDPDLGACPRWWPRDCR